MNLRKLAQARPTMPCIPLVVGKFPSPGLTAGRTDRPSVRPCIVSGRVGEEERFFLGRNSSNKSISNLMEALVTRPEGWTYSILKEPCV